MANDTFKTPSRQPQEIHIAGFLDRLKTLSAKQPDSSLLFVLGAGASSQSGIKTGTEMVADWLEMLRKDDLCHESVPAEQWATAERLGIPRFDPNDPAASYPDIFARVFQGRRKAGFDYLEREIAGKTPSFGYSVLAQILDGPKHKVVVTTNFDNLVVDALSIYTETTPNVCGHESLAGFIRHRPTRPQIVKVHRDLFYAPRNTSDELGPLPENFAGALRALFREHVPVVVGYGANDGSLMGVLNGLKPGELGEGIYWCYWNRGPKPRREILELVGRHRGWLVPIQGFDELMIRLQAALELTQLDEFLEKRGDERAKAYKERRDALGQGLIVSAAAAAVGTAARNESAEALQALQATIGRKGMTAPEWDSLAKLEADPVRRSGVYEDGLRALPSDPWMALYAARHFEQMPSMRARSEQLYESAIDLAGRNASILGSCAVFLAKMSHDPDRAEATFRRALDADPKNAVNLGNYAYFLKTHLKNDDAEAMFKRALAADPKNAHNLGNYARFLEIVRKDNDSAETTYKRALRRDRNHAVNLGNYASFLETVRKDNDAAEAVYKRALRADPNHAVNLGSYASFLEIVRKNNDAADANYKRALDADPNNADNLGNYAIFLEIIRHNNDAAEATYKRALDIDPNDAKNLGNYARLVLGNARISEGLALLDRVMRALNKSQPGAIDAECWMYAYCFSTAPDRLAALTRLKCLLLDHEIRTGSWDFSRVIKQAIALGHSESRWLPTLAAVLAGDQPPESLDPWEAWQLA